MAATFLVQNDLGTVLGANAYASLAYFRQYFQDRGNATASITDPAAQVAIVLATDYIDNRWSLRFAGRPLVSANFAQGVLTLVGQPTNGLTVLVNTKTYTFQSVLTNVDGNVAIGASVAASILNLANAINVASGLGVPGVDFAAATTKNRDVTAVATPTTLTATAIVAGEAANVLPLATTVFGASWSSPYLQGGGPQTTQFPRKNIYYDANDPVTGAQLPIVGVPIPLKKACCEYALRASALPLFVDGPTPMVNGERQPTSEVIGTDVRIGPLTTITRYADRPEDGYGTGTITTRRDLLLRIPAADTLIEYLLDSRGGGLQRRVMRS